MSTTFTNAGHSYTEAGYYQEEEKKVSPTEALSELLALHKREMHDGTITLKEWQTAIKKAEQSLKSEKAEV